MISRFAFASHPRGSTGRRKFPAERFSGGHTLDGTKIACRARRNNALFLRAIDHLNRSLCQARPMPLARSSHRMPVGRVLRMASSSWVPIHGGEATMLRCPHQSQRHLGTDNTIIFAPTLFGGLMRVGRRRLAEIVPLMSARASSPIAGQKFCPVGKPFCS